MIVEFLMNEIKDKTKIYERFSISEGYPDSGTNYVGNMYCDEIVKKIISNIPNSKSESYEAEPGRLAREIFKIISESGSIYKLTFTIDTYHASTEVMFKNSKMLVTIENEAKDASAYDVFLEKLKIKAKDILVEDWEKCIWIRDEQSQQLCSELYTLIFNAENRIRAFANNVLINELGLNWINCFGLEKYSESQKNLAERFRKKEPVFVNVDDVLISVTLETLFSIIKEGVVYNEPIQLSKEDYIELVNISKNKSFNAEKWLKRRLGVRKKIWQDIFEQFFSGTANSEQLITDFIVNRNHIAHNKPTSYAAFKKMKNCIQEFDEMVVKANEKFETSVTSAEMFITMEVQKQEEEQAEEFMLWEKNYLRDQIEECGVNILWEDDIYSELLERIENIYQKLYDNYYWNSMYSFEVNELNRTADYQPFVKIICNANNDYYVEFSVCFDINDDMDSNSIVYIKFAVYNENDLVEDSVIESEIGYHNGKGYIDDDGAIVLTSDSFFDESEIDFFVIAIEDAIDNLNPYMQIKKQMEYEAVKEGGPYPTADFTCIECDELGVSINENFYKFGHCCYCGTDNEIQACEICGEPFSSYTTGGRLCEYCYEKLHSDD